MEVFCAFLLRGNLEGILSFCEFFAVFFSEVFGVTSKGKRVGLQYSLGGFGLLFVWLLSGTDIRWNFKLILTCGELVVIPLFL